MADIPHALDVAYQDLTAKLDKGIAIYLDSYMNPRGRSICRQIERFVNALGGVQGAMEELSQRAKLVEMLCRPGSDYEIARENALAAYQNWSSRLTGAMVAEYEIRNSLTNPKFEENVDQIRQQIDRILDDGTVHPDDAARQALREWRQACSDVLKASQSAECFGSWFLHYVHACEAKGLSGEPELASGLLRSDAGGANLEAVKRAAESIMAWVAEGVRGADQSEIAECLAPGVDRREILNIPVTELVVAAAGQGEPESTDDCGQEMPTGFFGGTELADVLGVHPSQRDAFFQRLMRQRRHLAPASWREVSDHPPNSPQFLYRADSPELRQIAAGYKTSKPA